MLVFGFSIRPDRYSWRDDVSIDRRGCLSEQVSGQTAKHLLLRIQQFHENNHNAQSWFHEPLQQWNGRLDESDETEVTAMNESFLKARLWLFSLFSLLACAWVSAFNDVQLHNSQIHTAHLAAVLQIYINLQWVAFLLPALGVITAAVRTNKPSGRWRALASDLLLGLSLGWVFLAIFLWQLQQSPIVGLNGVK